MSLSAVGQLQRCTMVERLQPGNPIAAIGMNLKRRSKSRYVAPVSSNRMLSAVILHML